MDSPHLSNPRLGSSAPVDPKVKVELPQQPLRTTVTLAPHSQTCTVKVEDESSSLKHDQISSTNTQSNSNTNNLKNIKTEPQEAQHLEDKETSENNAPAYHEVDDLEETFHEIAEEEYTLSHSRTYPAKRSLSPVSPDGNEPQGADSESLDDEAISTPTTSPPNPGPNPKRRRISHPTMTLPSALKSTPKPTATTTTNPSSSSPNLKSLKQLLTTKNKTIKSLRAKTKDLKPLNLEVATLKQQIKTLEHQIAQERDVFVTQLLHSAEEARNLRDEIAVLTDRNRRNSGNTTKATTKATIATEEKKKVEKKKKN